MPGENDNPVEAGQFLGNDGAFQENWRDVAFDEDDALRTNPTLVNIKDIRTLARQVVSGESTIGKLSGGREFAILPNEQSTDDERNEYYKKTGRPDAPEGYKLNDVPLPEGVPKDEKFAEHMSNVLHKAGASTAVAAAVTKGYAEYIKSSLEAAATQEKIDSQEANTGLRKLWGAAYEPKMANAIAAANAFGNKISVEETAGLIKDLPYDSFGAQLLDAVGEVIKEKPLDGTPAAPTGELTPADARSKINEIMTDPYYTTDTPKDKPKNTAYHEGLVQKVNSLFKIKSGT